MFTDMAARHLVKTTTHSVVLAFAAKSTTRLLVREPVRKLRRDAMKSRSHGMSKASFNPHAPAAQRSQAGSSSGQSHTRSTHTLAPPLPKPKRPAAF